jgi:hypothetical protein
MPVIRIPWMVGQPRKHYWQEQARMVFYCDTLAVLRSKNQTNNCSVIQLDLLACLTNEAGPLADDADIHGTLRYNKSIHRRMLVVISDDSEVTLHTNSHSK